MKAVTPPFLFDTNSIRVVANYYPEHFPTFWEQFEKAVSSGMIGSVREVYNELDRQIDEKEPIWKWIEENKVVFAPPDEDESSFVGEIFKVAHFRNLIGQKQLLNGYPVADPFLIASAWSRDGCVVTEETFKPNAAGIWNVCTHFEVHCTNVLGFLKLMGWKF